MRVLFLGPVLFWYGIHAILILKWGMSMKQSLTLRYTLHQMTYWATAAGIVSFATAYLLGRGFAPSAVGTMLACGNLLSCGFQPVLAQWADQYQHPLLFQLVQVY